MILQRVTWNILHVHSSTAAHAVWLCWAQRGHTDFAVPSLPRPPILTQGHQPLPQDGHNRAGLQLLKACPAWPWPPSGISHGFLSHPDLGLTLSQGAAQCWSRHAAFNYLLRLMGAVGQVLAARADKGCSVSVHSVGPITYIPASLTSLFHSISNVKSNFTFCSDKIGMHGKSKGKRCFF